MSTEHAEFDVKNHVRVYIAVFAAVGILTLVNVAASYLTTTVAPGVTIALIIAIVNAALVAYYFMHLPTEGKVVHMVLAVTAVFLVALLFLIIGAIADQQGDYIQSPVVVEEPGHHVS